MALLVCGTNFFCVCCTLYLPPHLGSLHIKALSSTGSLNESGQLLLVYLSAYSVFVPAFPVHIVSAAMWSIALVQAITR